MSEQEPKRTGPSVKRGKSNQNYRTPEVFRMPIINRFGHPKWDLAADSENCFCSSQAGDVRHYLDVSDDSLKHDWRKLDGLLWLNPPYNKIVPWARKCHETCSARYSPGILFLVPASVGSNWYRDYIHDRARVFFLNGRIPFDPANPKWGYPKDCMLVHFGARPGFEVWNWTV